MSTGPVLSVFFASLLSFAMLSCAYRFPSYSSRKRPRAGLTLHCPNSPTRIIFKDLNHSFWLRGCDIGIIQVCITCSSQNQVVGSVKLRLTLGEGSFPNTKLKHCFQKKGDECCICKSHSCLLEILFLVSLKWRP